MPDESQLEPLDVLPEQELQLQTAVQAFLAQLELKRVRHHTMNTGTESCIAIHPDDISLFRHACRTLKQVRLIRTDEENGESRVILEDTGNGKRRYSVIRIVFTTNHAVAQPGSSRSTSVTFKDFLRKARAWTNPEGLFFVVLGPDGVGKSTTVQRLQTELQVLLGSCRKQRWRPGIIRKIAPDTSNRMPHSKPQRGRVISTIFVFGLALDFSIGYAVSAYPALVRAETIIFDRYFHDLLIDPRRYRYSGSMRLAQFLSRLMPPRKAIFIILDAEEDIILSRKQELTPQELRRQLSAYRAFGSSAAGSMIITTNKPVDEIVGEIIDKVLVVLAARNGNGQTTRRVSGRTIV
jgi:thymidylate kinase